MQRRTFLKTVTTAAAAIPWAGQLGSLGAIAESEKSPPARLDADPAKDWLARWRKNILADARNRYCDREMGEELGWLMSPFLSGFYYGYLATGDTTWVERLTDWADSWVKRGVKEPDGFIGWPKSGTGGAVEKELYTDSLLGESMALRPLVLMAGEILKTPALQGNPLGEGCSQACLAENFFLNRFRSLSGRNQSRRPQVPQIRR